MSREHEWMTHENCDKPACYVCELGVCKHCGGCEGGLPTECPGQMMSYDLTQEVYCERIDFVGGAWRLGHSNREPYRGSSER
jgi:hypothetical protein